jgi:hypothetical protein
MSILSPSAACPVGLSPARFFLACLALAALLVSAAKAAPEGKVDICHIPPDDPENVQILSISENAAQKHIDRHGDFLLGDAGELCDGRDNDCDREVDEDFTDLGAPCSDGVGGCLREGVYVCAPDGMGTLCSAVAGDPQSELCDNQIDDDCDLAEDCGDLDDCFFDPGIHDETSPQFVCKEPECGDGFVDLEEACDESASDCCDVACEFVEYGVPCQEDDNDCTHSECNGAGACEPKETDGDSCDGNGVDACSGPDTCLDGACQDNGPKAVPEVTCNGLDEDCDTDTPDVPEEDCDNGVDDDCDDLIDYDDEDDCGGCGCGGGSIL